MTSGNCLMLTPSLSNTNVQAHKLIHTRIWTCAHTSHIHAHTLTLTQSHIHTHTDTQWFMDVALCKISSSFLMIPNRDSCTKFEFHVESLSLILTNTHTPDNTTEHIALTFTPTGCSPYNSNFHLCAGLTPYLQPNKNLEDPGQDQVEAGQCQRRRQLTKEELD